MKSRQRYIPEFKTRQALDLLAAGKPVQEPTGELRVSRSLLYSWRSDSKSPQFGSEGSSAGGGRSEVGGLRALRREDARLQMEKDLLKKAGGILGTKVQPGSAK